MKVLQEKTVTVHQQYDTTKSLRTSNIKCPMLGRPKFPKACTRLSKEYGQYEQYFLLFNINGLISLLYTIYF